MAFNVLESLLRTYPTVSDYVLPNVVLSTIQQPVVTSTPSNQLPVKKYMLYAFVVAVLAVTGMIAVFSYFRDTVKNEEEFALFQLGTSLSV